MDREPIVCECCDAPDPGSEDAAKKAGWKIGWDGWLCAKCDTPPKRGCAVNGAIGRGVMCGHVIAGDHTQCGYTGELTCPHMVTPNRY